MIRVYSTTVRRKEMSAVLSRLVDEAVGPGEVNAEFEREIKRFTDSSYALSFRSPVDALKAALERACPEKGKEVLLSALSPAWQKVAVERSSLVPRFVDVEEKSALCAPSEIEKSINEKTGAIVHFEGMGFAGALSEIKALGVPVIEDSSFSLGSYFSSADEEPKLAASVGEWAVISLEEECPLTAGGGALLLRNGGTSEELTRMKGALMNFDSLPDINAALALATLKEFRRNESRRKAIYRKYTAALSGSKNLLLKGSAPLKSTVEENDGEEKDYFTACHFPVLLHSSFNEARSFSESYGVEIRLAYDFSCIASHKELYPHFPVAASLALRTALFPLHPRLDEEAVEAVSRVLRSLP